MTNQTQTPKQENTEFKPEIPLGEGSAVDYIEKAHAEHKKAKEKEAAEVKAKK